MLHINVSLYCYFCVVERIDNPIAPGDNWTGTRYELMVMIQDRNLAFLKVSDNEDLKTLVDYMIPRNSNHFLEQFKNKFLGISDGLSSNPAFKRSYPDNLTQICDLIVEELQKYGGSTIVNVLRFGGVQYSEILKDVCKKLKIQKYNERLGVEVNECELLKELLVRALDKKMLSDSDIRELSKTFGVQARLDTIQNAIALGSIGAFQIAAIVSNAVSSVILKRGLAYVAFNAGFLRNMAVLAGPVGLFITGIGLFVDASGPAYRITIPAVIQIAYMRQKFNNKAYNYFR